MISIKIYEILIIVFFKKILGIEVNKNIRIYATKNNYPRPLTLRNGEVLAFSGYKKTTITRYSKEVEEKEKILFFEEYDSNTDIKEVENNTFVLVSGKNRIMKIIFVDENSNMVLTILNEPWYYCTSPKINVLALTEKINGNIDGNKKIIISWINGNNLYKELFELQNSNQFKSLHHYSKKVDNIFVSCIQMKSSYNEKYHILCEYVNNSCRIYYDFYNKDFSTALSTNNFLYSNSNCAFDKIINLINHHYKGNVEKGSSCFLYNNHEFKCIFWTYDYTNYVLNPISFNSVINADKPQLFNNNIGIKFMDGCFNWIEGTDVIFASNNKIVATCLTNEVSQNRKVKIAIIEILEEKLYLSNSNYYKIKSQDLKYYVIELDSKGADFPMIALFGNYLSIFYNIGGIVKESEENNIKKIQREEGINVFEIVDTLLCKSIEIQINQNNSINFSTKELIFFGKMSPLSQVNEYKMVPMSFPEKKYLCRKGAHYSDFSSDLCGFTYGTETDNFDYTYYSLLSQSLGYKYFKFRGIYYINNVKNEGIICEVKIKVCSKECAECDDTFLMCTKCANDYYQKIETKYNQLFECFTKEIDNYVFNEISNYYEKCYDTCETCIKQKNYNEYIGTKTNQQCTLCKDGYLFQPLSLDNKIGNCLKECDPLYGIDDSQKNCVNCKLSDMYHIKGANIKCQSLIDISKDYYLLYNDPYNIFVPCADGTARKNNIYECEKVCDLNTHYWYTNHQGEVKCTNGLSCDIYDRSIFVESSKQCVLNCMNTLDSYCTKCIINDLFLYDGKCIENCPIGYEKDYKTHTCIPILKCNTYEITSKEILKEGEFDNAFKTYFYDYINKFDNLLFNDVKVVKGNNYTIELFKSDLCEYEVSSNYKISYVNLTECNDILVKKYEIKPYNIIWIKVDFPKINESNKYYYQAYNIEKEQIIDLNVCNNIDINIEMDFPESIDYKLLKEFYNKGIVLYNGSDDFFNDICFPFYDTNNNDVLINDRRNDYFLNYSFCDENCEIKLNFENNKINCKCQMVNNNFDINSTKYQNFKNENIKNEHISCFKCHNVVFNKKYFKKNAVSIVLLVSNVFNLLAYSYFFFGDLKSINFSMLKLIQNNIINIPNPPKKNNEKESKISKWKNLKNPQKFIQNTNSLNSNILYQTPSSNNSTSVMESSIRKIQKKDLSISEIDLCDLSKSKVNIFSEKNKINGVFSYISYEDLNFEEAKKLDKRTCSTCLSRIIGKKVIFFLPFSKSYKFEPCSIKVIIFLLQLMIISALICLFFKDKFIYERYKRKKSIGFGYTFKQMWIYCILIGLITSFIIYIFCAIIDNGKKNIKEVMGNYKIKIIIFMLFCFILMGLLWYYVSTFCGVFTKTQKAWFYSLIISIFFIFFIQIFYSMILGWIRYKSLNGDNKALYNVISAFI